MRFSECRLFHNGNTILSLNGHQPCLGINDAGHIPETVFFIRRLDSQYAAAHANISNLLTNLIQIFPIFSMKPWKHLNQQFSQGLSLGKLDDPFRTNPSLQYSQPISLNSPWA